MRFYFLYYSIQSSADSLFRKTEGEKICVYIYEREEGEGETGLSCPVSAGKMEAIHSEAIKKTCGYCCPLTMTINLLKQWCYKERSTKLSHPKLLSHGSEIFAWEEKQAVKKPLLFFPKELSSFTMECREFQS